MPRKKCSKKRPKINTTKDYAFQIAQKQETIASLNTEFAYITVNIDILKIALKKKAALNRQRQMLKPLKKLMTSGMSADDI